MPSRGFIGSAQLSPTAYATSGTAYINPSSLRSGGRSATEAEKEAALGYGCRLQGLHVYANASTNVTSAIYTLRDGGADTSVTLTILGNTSGDFYDDTNTADYTAGDKFCLKEVITSSGAFTMTISSVGLDVVRTTSDNAMTLYASDSSSSNSDGFGSFRATVSTTENNIGGWVQDAGVFRRMFSYVNSNPRTSNTVCRMRVNGVTVNQAFTVTASTTGYFEDASSSDTVTAGARFAMFFDHGSGTQIQTHSIYGVSFESTDNAMIVDLVVASNGVLGMINGTGYLIINGAGGNAVASEGNARHALRAGELSRLHARCISNTRGITTTATVRVNDTDTALEISLPAATTGDFSDTADTVAVAKGDTVNLKTVSDNIGNPNFRHFALSFGGAAFDDDRRRYIIVH